jgi:hypothetical protein
MQFMKGKIGEPNTFDKLYFIFVWVAVRTVGVFQKRANSVRLELELDKISTRNGNLLIPAS